MVFKLVGRGPGSFHNRRGRLRIPAVISGLGPLVDGSTRMIPQPDYFVISPLLIMIDCSCRWPVSKLSKQEFGVGMDGSEKARSTRDKRSQVRTHLPCVTNVQSHETKADIVLPDVHVAF